MCLSPKKRGPGVLERCWGQVGPDLGEGAARRLTQEQGKVEGTQGQAGLGGNSGDDFTASGRGMVRTPLDAPHPSPSSSAYATFAQMFALPALLPLFHLPGFEPSPPAHPVSRLSSMTHTQLL